MKWKDTLKASGFELKTYSKAIQTNVADLEELLKDKEAAKQDLKDSDDEEEIKEIEQEIKEIEKAIENLDAEVAKKMANYDKNRDFYAAQSIKLAEGRAKSKEKKAGKVEPTPAPTPDPTPTPTPDPTPAPTPDPTPKEEKSGGGWVVFGLLAIAGALIGVNFIKNKK